MIIIFIFLRKYVENFSTIGTFAYVIEGLEYFSESIWTFFVVHQL